MPRDKRSNYCVTKPIRVFNPIPESQVTAFCEYIKASPVIDQRSMRFLIWLITKTHRFAQAVQVLIPFEQNTLGATALEDIKRMVKLWHINLVIKCMGSDMKILGWESTNHPQGWIFQISPMRELDPEAFSAEFDLTAISRIEL